MAGMIARRLLSLVPILLLVSFAVFALITLVPGDAAVTLAGGEQATPEAIEQVRSKLGLDDPLLVQYGRWLASAVTLDLGESLLSGQSVSSQIAARFPITFGIALAAIAVGLVLGVPAGILSGMRPGSLTDRLALFGSSLGIAIPHFWLAMLLVALFAVNLGWLPAVGFTRFTESPLEWLRSITLPAIALGARAAASLARQTRAALIDVMNSSYVRTAWAKGGTARLVVGKHALKNAAIPAVTVLGLQLSVLVGGSVIIEQIFGIPGLGTYLLRAIISFDLPVVQGVTLVFVLVYVGMNLLVDISYGYLNPKVSVQ